MKKEIIIGAKMQLNSQEFIQGVKSAQDQLSKMYSAPQQIEMQRAIDQKLKQLGLGGLPGAPGRDQAAQAQRKASEESRKLLTEKIKSYDNIIKKEDDLKKKIEEFNKLKKNTIELEKDLNRTLEDRLRKEGEIAGLAQKQQTRAGVGQRIKEAMTPTNLVKGATVLAEAGLIASKIYGDILQRPATTEAAKGRATQGTFGRELEATYAGRSPFEMAFLPEKEKAAKIATEAMKGVALRDWTKSISSVVLQTIVGAAGGAAAGSAVPIIGNIAGGVIGGLGGLGHALTDKGTTNLLSSPFSQGANQSVMASRAQEFADTFTKALEGEKLQNPLKRLAAEEYQNNYMRNLQFQRAAGLDYTSFHGPSGFRQRAINAGFTDQMAMQSAGNILGAGGSTRMAQQSAFGLQLERGANLTNASGVLGSLSGGLGSAESTKNASIKILAEGTRLGLDQSQFAEENRKFAQATADIVARSGTKNDSDIDRIISNFSKFIAEPTSKGMEAARSAYEQYQQLSTATEGPQGVMRASGFLRSPTLGKLSSIDKMALSNIPAEQLTEDHPIVQDLVRRYPGLTAKDIVNERTKIDQGGINRLARADVLRESLKKQRVKLGIKGNDADFMGPVPEQYIKEKGELTTLIGAEYPNMLKDRQQLESFTNAQISGDTGTSRKMLEEAQRAKIAAPETGKIEDETIRGIAESSRLMLDNFRAFKDQIVPTSEAIRKFNSILQETVNIIMKMPETERSGSLQKFLTSLYESKTQTQSGK